MDDDEKTRQFRIELTAKDHTIKALREQVEKQREALHYFQEHGYSRKICSAALKESEDK